MHRRTALKLPLLLAAGAALASCPASADAGRWPAERANAWYQAQGWLVGANYITVERHQSARDVPAGHL